MRDVRTLTELAALEEEIAEIAVQGWDQDEGRFDWDGFLNRAERYLDITLPSDMLDPVIRKVQRIARAAVAETA